MVMSPHLPPIDGESSVSYVARLARFHANMNSHDYLRIVQLSRQDLTNGTDHATELITTMTGLPRERVEAMNFTHVGDKVFHHRGHRFGSHFAGREWTTYCPECLLEDADPGSPSAGLRVGRVNWFFLPVRTCPKHGIALVRRRTTHFSQRFQDMAFVAPDDQTLAMEARDAVHAEVSALQTYVERRFDGAAGPAWLDDQGIDQAVKASEMLGACLEFGVKCNLDELTAAQWDRAGAVGFQAAKAGPEGIGRALDELVARAREMNSRGGPQAAFGRLFQWVQFNKSGRDRGPIRDVLREYILDTMSIEPGTMLFGEEVVERRRHSIWSLSKTSGLHGKTLKRALVRSGILAGQDEDYMEPFTSFDAKAGEDLVARIQYSMPVTAIPKYLNCNRTQAERLVRGGVIPRLVPEREDRSGILKNVAIEDLDAFMVRFRSRGRAVLVPSEGMADAIEMSEIVRVAVIDIVRMVLDGELVDIELLPEEMKFRSVLVNPDEILDVLARRTPTEPDPIAEDLAA